jgi:CorA-like Mg2+ transporter protein
MAMLSVEQARIGNRQDATTEQLTILATIFPPLKLTGFFGQNSAGSPGRSPPWPRSSSTGSVPWRCRWLCCCRDSAG